MMSVSSLLSRTLALPACSAFRTLPFERQDRLDVAVAALLGRAAGRVAFDDEELGLLGIGAVAVVKLAGQVEPAADRRLAAHLRGGGPARLARLGRLDHPRRDRVADALVLEQEVLERRPGHRLDLRLDLRIVQPSLGLALELRLVHADREHGRQPFADVLALDLHPLLHQVVRLHEPLHGRADRREHPQLMRAAVARRDRVDERADVFVGRLGPGQGQVAPQAVVLILALEDERQRSDPLVVALAVDRVEKVDHAAVVPELDARLVLLIDELDDQALVEIALDLEPLGDQDGIVRVIAEDLGIGRERDRRARAARRLTLFDRPDRLAAAISLA